MAAKRMDLNKRTFLVLSGITNSLGKSLAEVLCRRIQPGSVALLIDTCEEELVAVKKELQQLGTGVKVYIATIDDWTGEQLNNVEFFAQFLEASLEMCIDINFERAIIVHNEGNTATHCLMEPQNMQDWMHYVQTQLYMPVALNQAFLRCAAFAGIEKLIVNVASSVRLHPLVFNQLLCSCQQARDMYFRAMATEEHRNNVAVISYRPGIMETHLAQYDLNNNIIDLADVGIDEQRMLLPRIKPLESTLKLINILEDTAFISGHEVDYYDTFVL